MCDMSYLENECTDFKNSNGFGNLSASGYQRLIDGPHTAYLTGLSCSTHDIQCEHEKDLGGLRRLAILFWSPKQKLREVPSLKK